MDRRQLVLCGLSAVVGGAAWATPQALQAAIVVFSGGTPVREGRVKLDISPLVENGNTVPVIVSVPGLDATEVRRLALFTERNPQPEVAVFQLGPLAGQAWVATRIRLATSQTVVAVAQLTDGSCWQHRVQLVVTLAACIEGD